MRLLHVLIILAFVLGAPLQAAGAGMACASDGAVAAQDVHADHAGGHAGHAPGEEQHHHAHDPAPAAEGYTHVCDGACAEPCGAACCQCAQSGVAAASLPISVDAAHPFTVSSLPTAAGRTVGAELRPPKSLHS